MAEIPAEAVSARTRTHRNGPSGRGEAGVYVLSPENDSLVVAANLLAAGEQSLGGPHCGWIGSIDTENGGWIGLDSGSRVRRVELKSSS